MDLALNKQQCAIKPIESKPSLLFVIIMIPIIYILTKYFQQFKNLRNSFKSTQKNSLKQPVKTMAT